MARLVLRSTDTLSERGCAPYGPQRSRYARAELRRVAAVLVCYAASCFVAPRPVSFVLYVAACVELRLMRKFE